MVPPFTLFEIVASQSSSVLRANNVKSGTADDEAAMRLTWAALATFQLHLIDALRTRAPGSR